jgi:hypothetical protein
MYSTNLRKSYRELRVLYLPVKVRQDAGIEPGEITVVHADDPGFSVTGILDAFGYITGMAKLWRYLDPQPDAVLEFDVSPDGSVVIASPAPPRTSPGDEVPGVLEAKSKTVFESKGLKHLHLEPFRPENLNRWQPETEPDVYMAFGVLQDYTDYQYCCGASKAVLEKLGADYSETAKPDAILIDRTTSQYVMAEWKKASSEYKLNHAPNDVDVLVCWEDNETNRSLLPPTVLPLRSIAQKAAERALAEDD